MFCTRLSVCLSVSGTPLEIVLEFTAVTHLESSMNWLDLVLNFQAWHFISKRTKVSFTLSTSCSAASLLHPTSGLGADKMSRSSAVRFSAGDCYFCILTLCWLYGSSELPRRACAQKIPISKKKPLVWLRILLQFKSQSDSFICLRCTLNHSPSHSSSLFLYRNTKLIKVRHPEIHQMFLKPEIRGTVLHTKTSADYLVCIVLRYFVVSNTTMVMLCQRYTIKKKHWFSISSTHFRI